MNFHFLGCQAEAGWWKNSPSHKIDQFYLIFSKVKIRFAVFFLTLDYHLIKSDIWFRKLSIITDNKTSQPLLVSFVLLEIIRKDWWNYFASNAAIRVKESFGKHWEVALFPWIGALSICNWCCAILNSGRHLSPKMTLEWIFFFLTKSSSNVSLSFDSRQKQRVLWMQHSTFIMVLHSRSSTSYKEDERSRYFHIDTMSISISGLIRFEYI